MKAAVAIKKSFPEAFFLMVGSGREHAELTHQIDRAGLSESFFLAGERTDVPDILEAADVFVLPSRYRRHWQKSSAGRRSSASSKSSVSERWCDAMKSCISAPPEGLCEET